jgi:uncharacterized protein (TIGR02284 family)
MESKTKNGPMVDGILEKLIDAEKGFQTASENAKGANLKHYFADKSRQRGSFVAELELELSQLPETEVTSNGSITADFHRSWMDLKATLSVDNDEAMLEESIRGEKAALKEFEEVLDAEYLSLEMRNLLSKQYSIIKNDLETIKSLEDLQDE